MYPKVQKSRYIRESKSPDVRRLNHPGARYPRSRYPKAGHPSLLDSKAQASSYEGAQWSIPSVRMIDLQKINDATRGLQAAETMILKTISFEQKGYQAVAVDALTR
jgi:hypothetical protein